MCLNVQQFMQKHRSKNEENLPDVELLLHPNLWSSVVLLTLWRQSEDLEALLLYCCGLKTSGSSLKPNQCFLGPGKTLIADWHTVKNITAEVNKWFDILKGTPQIWLHIFNKTHMLYINWGGVEFERWTFTRHEGSYKTHYLVALWWFWSTANIRD